MSGKKNLLIHTVKETIIRASKKGEDVINKVGEITEAAVRKAINVTNYTIDEIEEISWAVLEGSIHAARELGIETKKYIDNAIQGIKRGLQKTKVKGLDPAHHFMEDISKFFKIAAGRSRDTIHKKIKNRHNNVKDKFEKK